MKANSTKSNLGKQSVPLTSQNFFPHKNSDLSQGTKNNHTLQSPIKEGIDKLKQLWNVLKIFKKLVNNEF